MWDTCVFIIYFYCWKLEVLQKISDKYNNGQYNYIKFQYLMSSKSHRILTRDAPMELK